ncbi:hydroxyacylglutathione hydrolase [Paracoccus sp. S-4012]|uniref:hydroxyacylglutathione hydrolase n=1 Tax=Paracoccus sp. S-4012 TaxID=2665648 RepID=UPI0012B1078F|nr:hydroxyacylglutathione hydrolase [Paracoccus sp. S-4012]MRX51601.1 hydroxyacylglutathione hydrolase [Paracoccus sp. S-4012]
MPELMTIRCLRDNYAWAVHHEGRTVVFDAPEARPILQALKERGWTLDEIALTHHHDDHIQGVAELVAETGARVCGAARDAHRLPKLDRAVAPGDRIILAGMEAHVIDAAGHTTGHIAFHLPEAGMAATGDSLMAMGCGRLFEAGAATMWASLQRLDALPPETLICSGHDYCAGNAAFALSVEPGNAAIRARAEAVAAGDEPCAPGTLARERETNPFLRADRLGPAIGMEGAPPAEVFARLRAMKDAF